MSFVNLDRVLQQLADFGRGIEEGGKEQMRREAEEVLEKAKANCPVGEGPNAGKLRDSGHLVEVENGVEVIFDATDAATGQGYAAKVEFDLEAQHDDGGALYLSRARNEQLSGMAQRLAAAAVAAAKARSGAK